MGYFGTLDHSGKLFVRPNEPMHILETRLPSGENLSLQPLGDPAELGWIAGQEISSPRYAPHQLRDHEQGVLASLLLLFLINQMRRLGYRVSRVADLSRMIPFQNQKLYKRLLCYNHSVSPVTSPEGEGNGICGDLVFITSHPLKRGMWRPKQETWGVKGWHQKLPLSRGRRVGSDSAFITREGKIL